LRNRENRWGKGVFELQNPGGTQNLAGKFCSKTGVLGGVVGHVRRETVGEKRGRPTETRGKKKLGVNTDGGGQPLCDAPSNKKNQQDKPESTDKKKAGKVRMGGRGGQDPKANKWVINWEKKLTFHERKKPQQKKKKGAWPSNTTEEREKDKTRRGKA